MKSKWRGRKKTYDKHSCKKRKLSTFMVALTIFLASFTTIVIVMPTSYAEEEHPQPPPTRSVDIKGESESWDNFMRQRLIYRGTNYGDLDYILIDAWANLGYRNRGLIKFDISGNIPAGSHIESAALKLYFYDYTGDPDPRGDTVRLYKLRSGRDWSETTSSWNKYKSGSDWTVGGADDASYDRFGTYVTTTVPMSTDEWMEWDVTFDVTYFYEGTYPNNGWMFRYHDESGGERVAKFWSSEKSGSDLDPTLTITYIERPSCQTNAATGVEETNATAHGYVTDDGGDLCDAGFYYDTNPNPDENDNNVSADEKYITGYEFDKSLTSLTKGELYYVKAWVNNTAGYTTADNEKKFLTKPDGVTNFQATASSHNQIDLTWTNGDGTEYGGAYIEYKTGALISPWNPGGGTKIDADGYIYNDQYSHTVVPDTHYWYQAWAFAKDLPTGWKSTPNNTTAPLGDMDSDDVITPSPPPANTYKVTYRFSEFIPGDPPEVWPEYPEYMADEDEDTYAISFTPDERETLSENTCMETGEGLGSITTVEIRTKGHYITGAEPTPQNILLTPIFDGQPSEPQTFECSDVASWSQWFDITLVEGAPETWTWDYIVTLDCQVISAQDKGVELYCSMVEIRVTYTADPPDITYYYNTYDIFGDIWAFDPRNMADGNEGTWASTNVGNDIELLTGNILEGGEEPQGAITKVSIRAQGYYFGFANDIYLQPVFGGEADGRSCHFDCGASNEWSDWYDITDDERGAPSWKWEDIDNLDCRVIAGTLSGPVGEWYLYCSKVDIGVSYSEIFPPTADFNAEQNADHNKEIYFDASPSTPGSGGIISYEWDFNNDGTPEMNVTEPDVTYIFWMSSTYSVKLTVYDADGLKDSYIPMTPFVIAQNISLVSATSGENYITWGATESIQADELAGPSYANLQENDAIQMFNTNTGDWDIWYTYPGGPDFTINRWDNIRIHCAEQRSFSVAPDGNIDGSQDKTLTYTWDGETGNLGYNYYTWSKNFSIKASVFATNSYLDLSYQTISVYNHTDAEWKGYTEIPGLPQQVKDNMDFYIHPYDVICFKIGSEKDGVHYITDNYDRPT